MDKVNKFLNKLRQNEKLEAEQILDEIYSGKWEHLNIKKLSGFTNLYRVRKHSIRFIFRLLSTNPIEIQVISVGNKDDNTYKF